VSCFHWSELELCATRDACWFAPTLLEITGLLQTPPPFHLHIYAPTKTSRGSGARGTDADIDAISLLTNKKGGPLLMAMGGESSDSQGRLLLQRVSGAILLSDLQVGCLVGEVCTCMGRHCWL